jgi:DNA-binding XRE family transcriptional regulator
VTPDKTTKVTVRIKDGGAGLLRAALDAGPHTHQSLADAAGCSRQMVTALLGGARDVTSLRTAERVATALNLRVGDVFDLATATSRPK